MIPFWLRKSSWGVTLHLPTARLLTCECQVHVFIFMHGGRVLYRAHTFMLEWLICPIDMIDWLNDLLIDCTCSWNLWLVLLPLILAQPPPTSLSEWECTTYGGTSAIVLFEYFGDKCRTLWVWGYLYSPSYLFKWSWLNVTGISIALYECGDTSKSCLTHSKDHEWM